MGTYISTTNSKIEKFLRNKQMKLDHKSKGYSKNSKGHIIKINLENEQIDEELTIIISSIETLEQLQCSNFVTIRKNKNEQLEFQIIYQTKRVENTKYESQLTNEHLSCLPLFSGNLKELYLSNSGITTASMQYLAELKQLTILSLGNNTIDNQGIIYLTGLCELTHLYLNNIDITINSWVFFIMMPKLAQLNIQFNHKIIQKQKEIIRQMLKNVKKLHL